MKRRSLCLLAAAALVCGLLTGCQKTSETPETPSGEEDTVPVFTAPVAPADAIDPNSDEAGYPCLRMEDMRTGTPVAERLDGFGVGTENNPDLPFGLACHIADDGTVTGVLPAGVDLSALIPTFYYENGEVRLDGQPVISGQTVLDLTGPVTLTLVDKSGGEHTATVKLQTLYTGLPSVAVTTENNRAIASKTDSVPCSIYVGGGDANCCPYAADEAITVSAQVRGRGNSSWNYEKKSYSVNLDSSTALLDMPAARKWALVANYEDKSLIRNYVANYLVEQAEINSVLSIRPVDLWYNGHYWGSYNLCERISIHEARVNITEQEDVTGLEPSEVAYLFEFDGHVSEVENWQKRQWKRVGSYCYYDPTTDETFMSVSLGKKWLTIKNPGHDELTPEMANHVYKKIYDTCVALKHGDWATIESHIDVTSFVRWYIVEEYMNNADSSMHSSVFMYWDVGGKLTLCAPWDFDRSSDNCDYWNADNKPDSLYNSTAGWFTYLFQHEEARAILKTEWAAFSQKVAGIGEVVDGYADMMTLSQEYNFGKWPILSQHVGSNPHAVVRARTYPQQVTILREFLTKRLGDMDAFIQSLS